MLAGTGIKPRYEGVKKGTEGSPYVCCPRLIAIEASLPSERPVRFSDRRENESRKSMSRRSLRSREDES